ncbi:MAG: diguanylate cyclase [Solirubrobacterales bacterium]
MRRRLPSNPSNLLSDPPLRDRLRWRGLLTPRPDQTADPALKASTFGLLFSVAAVIALLAVLLDPRLIADEGLMLATAAASALLGLLCLIGYRRLPDWAFIAVATGGIVLIVVAATASERGTEPVYAPVFAIAAISVMVMFRLVPAIAMTLMATFAYGAILFARDNPYDYELLVSSMAMIIAIGGVIGVLRRRGAAIHGELSSEALTDQLTGIPNRRSFDQRFEVEKERTRRSNSCLGLIICDLDRFKRINDERGHDTGDDVLRYFAAALVASVRGVDLPARVGGEEFAILLPDATVEEGTTAAERIRDNLTANSEHAPVPFTASFGVASASADEAELRRLYQRADRALYAAKRAGRDCIAIAGGDENTEIIGASSPVARLKQLF